MKATERDIDVGSVTLSIAEAGKGGLPLLMLHGFTGRNTHFEPMMSRLAERGWHVVAPDHRGHGKSSKPEGEHNYSIGIFVSDTLELVDKLGWDTFVMIGHSMGGMIAQTLAIRAPQRVRGLVLMDTGHGPVEVDPMMIEAGVTLVRDYGIDRLIEVTRDLKDPLATPAHNRVCETDPTYKQYLEDSLRMCSPSMFVAMLLEITHPHERLPELKVITSPTLVIVGEQDKPFVEPSRAIVDAIPDARLVVLVGAGHSPQFEAPDELWKALLPFLDELVAKVERAVG